MLSLTAVNIHSLLGPLNFEAINESNRDHNKIPPNFWQKLSEKCTDVSLLPSTLGGNISYQISLQKKKKNRNKVNIVRSTQ